jgi:acetyl esterase/lipase
VGSVPVMRARLSVAAALFGSVLLLSGCWLLAPPAQGAMRTARLLPAFFVDLPVEPEAWGREAPAVSVEPLETTGEYAYLHVYRPPSGRHAALILSLGVNPAPPDDPRVVRLMGGLARAGLVAVLVQSSALDDDLITAEAPELLVRAFERVASRPDVKPERIGFAGFSVGAGLVSVAAADARIRDRVALVEAFGGYFDVEDLVIAVTTSTIRDGDRQMPWRPDRLSRSVVATNLVAAIPEPRQREAVYAALKGDAAARASLDEHARSVFDVLDNTDPERAAALYVRLPAPQRAALRSVSPAAHVEHLRAPVYLMHDRGDQLIPYVESRRFNAALVAAGRPPYFSEFDIFEHVDPTRGGRPLVVARDMVKLFMHIRAVLARLE